MFTESKGRRHAVQRVVTTALPSVAHFLRGNVDPDTRSSHQELDEDLQGWEQVTPVNATSAWDFPLLPAIDLTRDSGNLLGSLVSSFKSVPDMATWPMTWASISLYGSQILNNATFRVRARDLSSMWCALPGSGGLVRSLQWRRDSTGMSHESVILEVAGTHPSDDRWWICLERFPEGDLATLSRNRESVIRPGSKIRAEKKFVEELSFGHVLRVLDIIHDVSPDYFVIGANCWFYASIIVEMLNLQLGASNAAISLKDCDHRTTKGLNHRQYSAIDARVRALSNPGALRKKRHYASVFN